MLLTVEIRDARNIHEAEAVICFDDEGLESLIARLTRLRGKKGHDHLMTSAWAGDELTENKQSGDEYELINHLRLVKK